MKRSLLFTAGLLVALLLVLPTAFLIVRQGEVAVITTFGRTTRVIAEPGLYLKFPRPVQRQHLYDTRLRVHEGALEQTQTRDSRSIVVTAYAGWRVAEPALVYQKGGLEDAERNIAALLRNAKVAAFGRHEFTEIVNPDAAKLKFDEIEREILADVAPAALQRYGLKIEFAGLRKIRLPEAITEKAFAFMREEREQAAKGIRTQGENESRRIRAEADSRRAQILAQARAEATRIRAEGEAEAAKSYAVFQQNPALAAFLRKLEALEGTLKSRSTVILGADTPPYDLFKAPPAAPKAP
ncbi:MAG: protease modulator HflC [Kiritimatiellia bacterium]